MTTTARPSCVIYCRFSPRRNADKCESIEVQEAFCEQHASENGLTVAGSFQDRALSGDDQNRPGLWAAVEALPKNGTLLVLKRDRLARNVYLEECIKRAVESRGGKIEAVQGDVQGDGPEQILIRQVLSSIAEYEKKIIGIRTKWAMLDRQRRGQRMGRFAPYGFQLDPKDQNFLIPDELEQVAVKEIEKLWGTMTISAIRTLMNSKYSELSRGNGWQFATIKKIGERFDRETKANGVDKNPDPAVHSR